MGGSGLSALDAALIFEALSTGCPSIAAYLSIHNMATWMIDRFGDERQRRDWLPKLCAMEWLGSYCLTEPGSGSDAAALKTHAVRDGDHYVLNGAKQFISGAGSADLYVTMARTGGPGAARHLGHRRGRRTRPAFPSAPTRRRWAGTRSRRARSRSTKCARPRREPAGRGGRRASRSPWPGSIGGRLNIAACSLGGAQAALDKTVLYMREREAFGQPLAEFQALQFRVADMATELEAARTLLYRAAAKLDAGASDATTFCAMAKRFATDVGFSVANEALQLHGGYGYLAEYRNREDRARSARASDPGGDQRDHAADHLARDPRRSAASMSPAGGSELIVRREGAAGRITLNRPEALNALTLEMIEGLAEALDAFEADPAVRTVVLDGAGERGFCAGGDIRALYESRPRRPRLRRRFLARGIPAGPQHRPLPEATWFPSWTES